MIKMFAVLAFFIIHTACVHAQMVNKVVAVVNDEIVTQQDVNQLLAVLYAQQVQAYKGDELVGKIVIYLANLKPRKMKFGLSEGMILAAGTGGKDIFMLSADTGAKPGQRVL